MNPNAVAEIMNLKTYPVGAPPRTRRTCAEPNAMAQMTDFMRNP